MEQEKPKSDNDKAIDFQIFARNLKATSEEIEKAYFHLCGAQDGDVGNGVVKNLLDEMTRLSKEGFPINRFAKLVNTEQTLENGENEYLAYVNKLPITEKEKQVLWSIVSKERTGELALFKNDEMVTSFEIDNNRAKHIIALQLTELVKTHLQNFSPKDHLAISFTPHE